MGKIISRTAKRFFQKSEMRIVMIGLDSSGKTTILYKLKMGQTVRTISTIGILRFMAVATCPSFNVEIVEYKNVSLTVWDVGGQKAKCGFDLCGNITFKIYMALSLWWTAVIDRISEARNELHNILTDFELRSAMLLVFANKQDPPDSMSVHEMANKLGLHSLHHLCCRVYSEYICHLRPRTLSRS